jgi:hypothetical protein
MSIKIRLAALTVAVVCCSAPGFATANYSFSGKFVNDNDVQLFAFSLFSGGSITLQTLGYGGGTNANGQVISPGGFEPVLQVFLASDGSQAAGQILPGANPPCAPRNPDPGRSNFCLDAYGQLTLLAGDYILALTQEPNESLGNLSLGFFYVDVIPDPHFNNGFYGSTGLPGTGAWALDILSVDVASTVPEPASFALGLGGVVLLAVARRSVEKRVKSAILYL